MNESFDVIVVGAGIAGLEAARSLSSRKINVLVVEARKRVGGRIYTWHDKHSPIPIELGAEFVHGRPENTWQALTRANVHPSRVPDRQFVFENGRIEGAKDLWSKLDSVFSRMRQERHRDRSFHDFLRRHASDVDPRLRALSTQFVEGFNAARADRISVKALLRAEDSPDAVDVSQSFRLFAGYDALPKWMCAQLDPEFASVRLGMAVRSIRWRRGKVEVASATKKWQAARAVITLPLGVLKLPARHPQAVVFAPSIKEKLDAIERLEMGPVIRIILRFKERFWARDRRLAKMSFLHSLETPLRTWWAPTPSDAPLLTGWAGGAQAEPFAGRSSQHVFNAALDSLAVIFGKSRRDIARLVEDHYFHDWQSDPYSFGAYSYVPVGGLNAAQRLARPLQRTLYFAGEATDTSGNTGTVNGAMATGSRAAEEILRDLKVEI